MKISVTQDHIKRGEPGSLDQCPVALAIKEQLAIPDMWFLSVGHSGLYAADHTYDVTPEVKEFMLAFDYGKEVEPFEFELVKSNRSNLNW